jgi:hypothetical protein
MTAATAASPALTFRFLWTDMGELLPNVKCGPPENRPLKPFSRLERSWMIGARCDAI